MFTLFMILMVAWVVTRWVGGSRCGYPRSMDRARREGWGLEDGGVEADRQLSAGMSGRRSGGRHAHRREADSRARGATVAVETPLEKLQRQFASGAITVEQYEHEVGKLYGVRGEA